MNTLKLETEPDDEGDVRIWVFIDGQKHFQIGIDCLDECFLVREPLSGDSYLKRYLKSGNEKIVDFGFCEEDCCASTLASIGFLPETVKWTGLHPTTGAGDSPQPSFTFDREAYDLEINRCLAFLAGHYRLLYANLRYPPSPERRPQSKA